MKYTTFELLVARDAGLFEQIGTIRSVARACKLGKRLPEDQLTPKSRACRKHRDKKVSDQLNSMPKPLKPPGKR